MITGFYSCFILYTVLTNKLIKSKSRILAFYKPIDRSLETSIRIDPLRDNHNSSCTNKQVDHCPKHGSNLEEEEHLGLGFPSVLSLLSSQKGLAKG